MCAALSWVCAPGVGSWDRRVPVPLIPVGDSSDKLGQVMESEVLVGGPGAGGDDGGVGLPDSMSELGLDPEVVPVEEFEEEAVVVLPGVLVETCGLLTGVVVEPGLFCAVGRESAHVVTTFLFAPAFRCPARFADSGRTDEEDDCFWSVVVGGPGKDVAEGM